jgi:glycosyltransferase involved in cell wall biosynthesis
VTGPGLAIIAERFPPEPGGLARASERIAALAARRGERVHVLTGSRRTTPGLRSQRARDGFVVHGVGELASAEDRMRALVDHAVEVVEQNDLDLVHGIYADGAGYAATLAAAWAGVPAVVSLRGNDFDRALFRAERLPLVTHAVRRARVVTAVTREMAARAEATFGREVRFVPNSVDADAFTLLEDDQRAVLQLRDTLGIGAAPTLGHLGQLREKKGMRYLLPAFARLAREREVHLVLIGGVRSDAEEALAVFRRAEPDACTRLHLVPYDASPRRLSLLLALCDVMIFPSLFEGMPNAVLESMAAARPILASDVGGHAELIVHGERGALLGLADLEHLPAALAEMLDLPLERRRALGESARAWVRGHHGLGDESAAWQAVYAEARSAS